jgi:hypothetical protein
VPGIEPSLEAPDAPKKVWPAQHDKTDQGQKFGEGIGNEQRRTSACPFSVFQHASQTLAFPNDSLAASVWAFESRPPGERPSFRPRYCLLREYVGDLK